ncbi:hypothetical protein ELUMI_v1c03450 [Williamsoniiplasma luminosum]|uniref:Probable membrane transporter protein n=1 Tax=Williamsoniiplasma luminosum TaxID=214888 RepID=A0A2K8NTA1_9MOLU|nr:sulfite exporter TauE/SafE family protein [Williamsoniiplasma luminosum]ATZ17070.1 hypothetical protein ELUMI_v1c03450 [Williamsoniiplasma luminosum]
MVKLKRLSKSTEIQEKIEFEKPREKERKRAVYMLILAIALAGVAGAICINIFLLYPYKNKGVAFSLTQSPDNLIAFILMMTLVVTGVIYAIWYFWSVSKIKFNDAEQNTVKVGTIGFVAAFLDTIGVGSFAVTTGLLKGTKTIKDDSLLPGTLNVTFGLSALFESGFLIGAIKVDPYTLMILVVSVIAGTVLGSFFVSRLKNPRIVKLIMGSVLFIVGIVMILTHPDVKVIETISADQEGFIGFLDKGNEWRMATSAIIFFFLGTVMSFGVGLYAPSMAVLTLLGMKATAIFPIMSAGASLCMIFGSFKFIKSKKYMEKTASTMMMAGIFGAICSFLIFFVGVQMGLGVDEETFGRILKYVAICVVFYASILMLTEYILGFRKDHPHQHLESGESKQKIRKRPWSKP